MPLLTYLLYFNLKALEYALIYQNQASFPHALSLKRSGCPPIFISLLKQVNHYLSTVKKKKIRANFLKPISARICFGLFSKSTYILKRASEKFTRILWHSWYCLTPKSHFQVVLSRFANESHACKTSLLAESYFTFLYFFYFFESGKFYLQSIFPDSFWQRYKRKRAILFLEIYVFWAFASQNVI